jgi:hypothetical protein
VAIQRRHLKYETVAQFKSVWLRASCAASNFVRAFSPPRKLSSPDRNPPVVINVFTLFLLESEDLTGPFFGHFQPFFLKIRVLTYYESGLSTEKITVSFYSECQRD